MEQRDLLAWLDVQGGPIIRYRLVHQLGWEVGAAERAERQEMLLANPTVQYWLSCLRPAFRSDDLHSSRDTAFENAIGKLVTLGCHRGMAPLDAAAQPFLTWLHEKPEGGGSAWTHWYRTLVAAGLARAGYGDDEAVRAVMTRRLDTLAAFAATMDFDLFVDTASYRGIPTAFSHKKLVDPRLYKGEQVQLAIIHDINGLASYFAAPDPALPLDKMEILLRYLLHPDYQRARPGHAMVTDGKRYYGMGWDVTLPGFFGFDQPDLAVNDLVLRLETLARFALVRAHPWYAAALAHLEQFRTAQGTYRFPSAYLIERTGYGVSGYHMGLGEERRRRVALEVESTFWMARIRHLMG